MAKDCVKATDSGVQPKRDGRPCPLCKPRGQYERDRKRGLGRKLIQANCKLCKGTGRIPSVNRLHARESEAINRQSGSGASGRAGQNETDVSATGPGNGSPERGD